MLMADYMLGRYLNVYKIFTNSKFRELYAELRFNYFIKVQKLKTSPEVSSVLKYEYSKQHFKSYQSISDRVTFLTKIIGGFNPNKNSKLLVIGPRYESELFGYLGLGVRKKNMEAIDLFSYSPMIKISNAHDLAYKKNTFDFIIAGWTVAYSNSLDIFFKESNRVMKPSGRLIITFDLTEDIEQYLNKFLNLKSPLIPMVNGKYYKIASSMILKSNSIFIIDNFSLMNVFWSGAREETPIGYIVLRKKERK